MVPTGIVIGAVGHAGIRLHCAACEWEAVYPCLDLASAVLAAKEHRARDCRPATADGKGL
jgi:hypothetical protein